jgi:hypothetical protein
MKNYRFVIYVLGCAAIGFAVWALLHFTAPKPQGQSTNKSSNVVSATNPEQWAQAIAKVKEDRGEAANQGGISVPAQLRHYEDRHWFLATQVAEVRKHNVQSCQDFVDLAAMLERGELVNVPAVTDTYVLFGVGAKADEGVFTRYANDQTIGLYDDAQLHDSYTRLDASRATLESVIANLKSQLGGPKKRNHASDIQKQITAREQELKAVDEERAALDQFYGPPDSRQRLFRDYESLKTLARSFAGRSYDLDSSTDRQALKLSLLRSLRPVALKVLEEIAADYHRTFDRPLPVSSLVRPEQYQKVLHRVNRNATLIDTPPHSTGLAFDIDYRYMGAAETAFLMTELARMKDAGRIEVLRERNANYHVFAFLDGVRPSDDLITASLAEVSPPDKEDDQPAEKAEKSKSTPQKTKDQPSKPKRKR